MRRLQSILVGSLLLICFESLAIEIIQENTLEMPQTGWHQLKILTPDLLELTLITTKELNPAPVKEWNFVGNDSKLSLPSTNELVVTVAGKIVPVEKMGFKRRPIYAPLKKRDLRIGNYLYLQLGRPIAENETVEVKNPGTRLWQAQTRFVAQSDPMRWSPAIHVNQEGYIPGLPKKAMVGFFLGSMGEMKVAADAGFNLINLNSGKAVFSGKLEARPDVGYTYIVLPYQQVCEADFSAFKEPGEYALQISGLGVSFPFSIDEGMGANFARTYALGLYHQRCGIANELPFTRFVHGPCHTKPAEVPTRAFETVNEVLKNESGDFASNPRHTARQLNNVESSLYPFVNKNKIDVSGGHHDAGDYSKYTINSAQLIHVLVFAADAFKGVGALDNLGLPESG
ncbi:MAG: glycoside hydrolase family 9 protein, partial [Verrucomicrobiota bacterium]